MLVFASNHKLTEAIQPKFPIPKIFRILRVFVNNSGFRIRHVDNRNMVFNESFARIVAKFRTRSTKHCRQHTTLLFLGLHECTSHFVPELPTHPKF